jgi:hypothetical protein
MKLSTLVKHANRAMGFGSKTISELLPYFDECVDDINTDLNLNLPLFTEVYENDFDKTEDEIANYTYLDPTDTNYNGEDHEYLRIPAAFLRNFVAYEAAYRMLRDEDEDFEVYATKQRHAQNNYRKLVSLYNNYYLEDTEVVTMGGDVDELLGVTDYEDDTGIGFYNPIDPLDQSDE